MKIIRFLFVAIATLLCSVSVNAENIEFADAKVKELCVANWDTNGDGELSKAEAAAVRDLGEVFTAHIDITSFNELQYFTGLTSIGQSAFCGCYYLTSITIPNGVTSIGDFAFFQCSDLTSIVIPDGVISIGNYALAACSGLISVIIGDGVISIGQSAFGSCSMTSITIPNSVTRIGYAAFSSCTGLTSINVDKDNRIYDSREDCNAIIETATNTLCSGCINTVIPNSVTCIGGNAFFRCSGLTSITIPNSVTSIGNSAFLGCTGLTSITIPISVTNIDNYAFYDCNNLTFVTVESKTPITLSSEDTFHDPTRITLNVPTNYKVAYEAADVWKSFKEIVEYDKNIEFADAKVKELCVVNWDTNVDGEISLAEAAAVTDIGTIFKGKNITSFDELIYFTGLTSIGEEAFQANSTLVSLTIPNGVKSIGDYAFFYCTGLTSITIPNSVTSIGFSAFSGCYSLISVSIPNSVTSIGTSAFYLCSGLTSVTIGNSVTSIGRATFSNCYSLASVTIGNSVASIDIDGGAFHLCPLTSINIDKDNSIYDSRDNSNAIIETATNTLYKGCKNTVIPNSVTSIGSGAFSSCDGLTSIIIPNSVTSIGDGAFSDCYELTSVTIKSNKPIALSSGYTFSNRANATLYVPLGSKAAYEAAEVWKEFKEIVEYDKNIEFADAKVKELCVANWDTNGDGELSTAEAAAVSDLGEVFKQNEDITSFNELQYFTGLKSIGNYAFQYCTGLTTINIPNSVTSIGSSAFNGCSSLTSIVIPVGVTCIESMSFWQCVNMTSITLPNTLKKIGNTAFNGCSSLTSIVIPNSVEEISEWAFENCPNLTSVTVENENPISLTTTYWTFSNRTNAILYVPKGCKEAYKAAGEWNEFKDIIEYDSWGNICFNDSKVKELCIANWDTNADGELSFEEAEAVSDIGSVFKDNDEIKSFNELQRFTNLTNINNEAFSSCSSLISVTLPNSVTRIGDNAFYNCSNLTSINIPNNMTSIGEHAFLYCEGLACIIVDSRNKVFDSRSNCNAIINTESNTLVVGCKTTIIPNSVTGIGNDALNYCSGLTSIDIPNSVTSIGSRAFYCCYRLTSLEIPSSVISIGEHAFSGCIGLTSILVDDGNSVYDSRDNCNAIIETATNTLHTGCVYTTIPNNVSNIGTDAFFYCITLTSINIPKNVTSIGPYAFNMCFNLEKVIVEHETPISLVSETTFSNRFNATLYVPYGSKSAYEAAEVWKDFKEIVEMKPTEITLTLNQYGKSTYCSEYALDFTNVEGLKAYVATGYNTRTGVVTMTRVMTTKGGTGLFLKGEQGSYEVPIIAESDDNTLNLLVGTLAQVTLNSKDDTYTNYKFTVKAGETEPGFYNFADNSTLSANKAYLHIPTAWLPSTSDAKNVRMWFEDEEATGIDEINTNRPDSDTIYDMQGRRVKNPSKGMYIVNGKKMIIK